MARAGGRLIRFARRATVERPRIDPAELVAALPVATIAIDDGDVVRDCNAATEALINRARGWAIGRPLADAIGPPPGRLPHDQPYAAFAIDIMLPDARPCRCDLMVAPAATRAGWRVLTIHPASSHGIAARRGDRADRALPATAAARMLAHEVKNPLSGIRGAAQLLETGASADQIELTRLIRREVDRIAGLIDRMEGLATTELRPRVAINIHEVLGHVRNLAAAGVATGMTIREVYDPSLPELLGDHDALVQILLNLIRNAAEAAGPGGTITLRTAYRHGVTVAAADGGNGIALPIEIAVIDDGPGAPAHIEARLFEPFVSGRPNGTGLGLALVDKLVDEMGGAVDYARERDPPRTVLRLLMPRVPR